MALFSFNVYNKQTNATMMMKNLDGETALSVLKTHDNYKFLDSTIQMIQLFEGKEIETTIYHNMPDPDPENDPENPFGKNYVHEEELDVKDKDYFRLAITRLAMLGEYENHEDDKHK